VHENADASASAFLFVAGGRLSWPGQAYAEGNPPKARRNASSHSNCSFESGEQGLFIVVVLVGMAVLSEAV